MTGSSENWEDMNNNLLLKVFSFLTVFDVVTNVANVCRSWRNAAHDYCMLLRTLDVANVRKQHAFFAQDLTRIDATDKGQGYLGMGCLPLLALDISASGIRTGQHLINIAQRCRNLKELGLPPLPEITDEQLADAFRMWPNLESLVLTISTYPEPAPIIFRSIGESCRNLSLLRFRATFFPTESATLLISYLPNLKILGFSCLDLQKQTVMILLEKLQNLEELYVSMKSLDILPVRYAVALANGYNSLILRDQEIMQQASWLRKFHLCQTVDCKECSN